MRLAETVHHAHRRVHETHALRDQSPAARRTWEEAALRFRDTLKLMYGEGDFERHIADIRNGDPNSVDRAILFLEADPWCFGIGYTKERLISALKNVDLGADQRTRLTDALLHTLRDSRGRREMRDWIRLAPHLDPDRIRVAVRDMLASDNAGLRRRADWFVREFDWMTTHQPRNLRPSGS